MWKYFSFINFGNPLYILAKNGTPKEALTSHVGQQKFTRCLFKYMIMENTTVQCCYFSLTHFYSKNWSFENIGWKRIFKIKEFNTLISLSQ